MKGPRGRKVVITTFQENARLHPSQEQRLVGGSRPDRGTQKPKRGVRHRAFRPGSRDVGQPPVYFATSSNVREEFKKSGPAEGHWRLPVAPRTMLQLWRLAANMIALVKKKGGEKKTRSHKKR